MCMLMYLSHRLLKFVMYFPNRIDQVSILDVLAEILPRSPFVKPSHILLKAPVPGLQTLSGGVWMIPHVFPTPTHLSSDILLKTYQSYYKFLELIATILEWPAPVHTAVNTTSGSCVLFYPQSFFPLWSWNAWIRLPGW